MKIFKNNKIVGSMINILALAVLVGIYAFSFVKYRSNINQVLQGSKWSNANLDIVAIVEVIVTTVLPQVLFILIGLIILRIFMKLNEVEICTAEVIFQFLVFGIILSLNVLLKNIFANPTNVVINNDLQFDTMFVNLRNMNDFCTGLDLVVNVDEMKGFLRALLLNINIFSIAGFIYLYNFIHKKMGNCIPVLIILVVLFLVIAGLIGGIDLTSITQWSDL